VAADPADDTVDDPPRARAVRPIHWSEAQRIHQGNRTRAHREDIADDAADTRRGALIRFDERRMVVRLDLEDGREPSADIDRAGVITGALEHARAARGQLLQMDARALVAAVLGPHHRKDAQL